MYFDKPGKDNTGTLELAGHLKRWWWHQLYGLRAIEIFDGPRITVTYHMEPFKNADMMSKKTCKTKG